MDDLTRKLISKCSYQQDFAAALKFAADVLAILNKHDADQPTILMSSIELYETEKVVNGTSSA